MKTSRKIKTKARIAWAPITIDGHILHWCIADTKRGCQESYPCSPSDVRFARVRIEEYVK